jgi:hypothetical protein
MRHHDDEAAEHEEQVDPSVSRPEQATKRYRSASPDKNVLKVEHHNQQRRAAPQRFEGSQLASLLGRSCGLCRS